MDGTYIPYKYWRSLISGAEQRGLEFTINAVAMWETLEKNNFICAISGVLLIVSSKSKEMTASVDRIDSDKGYTPGNVWWVHKEVNKMKWDSELKDFLAWCHIITLNCKENYDSIYHREQL